MHSTEEEKHSGQHCKMKKIMSVCTNELINKERKKKEKNCKRTKVANVRPHIYFAWLDDKSVEEEQ